MTLVLLRFKDGQTEAVPHSHVHGFRDGQLQIATGSPGAGLDAVVIREVPVSDLDSAETCSKDDEGEAEAESTSDGAHGSGWTMSWPDD